MASLRRWVFAGLLGCLVVAVAYVPPRGAKSSGRSPFFVRLAQGTPARRRAQALAEDWRAADGSVRLLNARRQLTDVVRRVSDSGISLVVVSESAGVSIATPRLADSALRIGWRRLGLGETKVNVAVVLQLTALHATRDRPVDDEVVAAYLAPDSTDRTTCIAVVSIGRYWSRVLARDPSVRVLNPGDALVQALKAGVGPCAFYAAYGTPSSSVRGWLVARGWDLGANFDPGPRVRPGNSLIGMADPRYPWYWDAIYSLPPSAVACLARRPEACRTAVLSGASDDPAIPSPDIMRVDRRWNRVPRLAEGHRFLADVAHEIGRERFLSFWNSPLPVDTALALALKRPVGEWTAEWQGDLAQPIRLGPAAPFGGSVIALCLAALALTLVTVTASRRQVR